LLEIFICRKEEADQTHGMGSRYLTLAISMPKTKNDVKKSVIEKDAEDFSIRNALRFVFNYSLY